MITVQEEQKIKKKQFRNGFWYINQTGIVIYVISWNEIVVLGNNTCGPIVLNGDGLNNEHLWRQIEVNIDVKYS